MAIVLTAPDEPATATEAAATESVATPTNPLTLPARALAQRCFAEGIGTFALIFAGTGAIIVDALSGGAISMLASLSPSVSSSSR